MDVHGHAHTQAHAHAHMRTHALVQRQRRPELGLAARRVDGRRGGRAVQRRVRPTELCKQGSGGCCDSCRDGAVQRRRRPPELCSTAMTVSSVVWVGVHARVLTQYVNTVRRYTNTVHGYGQQEDRKQRGPQPTARAESRAVVVTTHSQPTNQPTYLQVRRRQVEEDGRHDRAVRGTAARVLHRQRPAVRKQRLRVLRGLEVAVALGLPQSSGGARRDTHVRENGRAARLAETAQPRGCSAV